MNAHRSEHANPVEFAQVMAMLGHRDDAPTPAAALTPEQLAEQVRMLHSIYTADQQNDAQ